MHHMKTELVVEYASLELSAAGHPPADAIMQLSRSCSGYEAIDRAKCMVDLGNHLHDQSQCIPPPKSSPSRDMPFCRPLLLRQWYLSGTHRLSTNFDTMLCEEPWSPLGFNIYFPCNLL